MNRSDILVIGAGQNGLALACALALSGLTVRVLDHQEVGLGGGSPLRVSALTQTSLNFLKKLEVDLSALSYFEGMEIWESELALPKRLHLKPKKTEDYLGAISQNNLLQVALFRRAIELGVKFTVTKIQKVEQFSNAVRVLTEQGNFEAEVLVGADGANSQIRSLVGIQTVFKPYDQIALVAVIQTEKPHEKIAYQRFLPEGPLAFLPLSNPHECSIVWSLSPEQAAKYRQLEKAEFEAELSQAFQDRLGELRCISDRLNFELRWHHAEKYIADRVVLMGDAAHVIHPLAGLGLNLGLKDAMALEKILNIAKSQNRSLGSRQVLSKYERERRPDNLKISLGMTGVNTLFRANLMGLSWLRQEGMRWIDRSTFAKYVLLNQI